MCWGNAYTGVMTNFTIGPGVRHTLSVFNSYSTSWSSDTYSGASLILDVRPIQMLWQASDAARLTSTSASATGPTTGVSSGPDTGSGLPRAVVITIATVVPVVCILIVVIVALVIRQRKTREVSESNEGTGRPELDARDNVPVISELPLPPPPPQELLVAGGRYAGYGYGYGQEIRGEHELYASNAGAAPEWARYELDTSRHRP